MLVEAPAPPQSLPLPVVATDRGDLPDLLSRIQRDRASLERDLLHQGALLLRGWDVSTLEQFGEVVRALSAGEPLFDYAGGASPRSRLGSEAGVYTSTEYPPHVGLSLHNELSYADLYPRRLYFFCLVAPAHGGETTLGDSRRILRRIDPDVVRAFKSRGVRYIRNLSSEKGSGYSWQEAFGSDNRQEVEERCRRIGAEFEWREGGLLRLSQVRSATVTHPKTGEEVWFNQADGFHPSVLDPATYAAEMLACGSEENFRLNVTYGDGAPIERAALEDVRKVLREETIPHRWLAGDILVLDNLLTAHGRMPFSGPRKIALAMT